MVFLGVTSSKLGKTVENCPREWLHAAGWRGKFNPLQCAFMDCCMSGAAIELDESVLVSFKPAVGVITGWGSS